jgi:hypothetical protein
MFPIPPGIDRYATAMKGREQFPSGGLLRLDSSRANLRIRLSDFYQAAS